MSKKESYSAVVESGSCSTDYRRAPRYMIGASIQDWHQMGLDARENARDAFGDELPPATSAWLFVLDNPEIFGDCEEWPKDFPGSMPRDFRAAYESGEVANA